MKVRRIPERMCTGCMVHRPKTELIRVVKSPDGEISIDKTGKKSGRGAYICNDAECLKKARKSRRLNKAFECEIPEEIYERLMEEISNG